MFALAEVQSRFRNAVVEGDFAGVALLVTGGYDRKRRLAIHQRNYEASLLAAMRAKFPACTWLLGPAIMDEAARRFVRESPPQEPCIAEYGGAFPLFLERFCDAVRVPYLREFAELEWIAGQVSVAAWQGSLSLNDLSMIDPDAISEVTLSLQEGVRYLHVSWPVDDLLKLYLSSAAPDRYRFEPEALWLEIRGSRGEFQMHRLSHGEFVFRELVAAGNCIGVAAEAAFDVDAEFDPGAALTELINAGLGRSGTRLIA